MTGGIGEILVSKHVEVFVCVFFRSVFLVNLLTKAPNIPKCAGEGCGRSDGLIMWKTKKYYIESGRKGTFCVQC